MSFALKSDVAMRAHWGVDGGFMESRDAAGAVSCDARRRIIIGARSIQIRRAWGLLASRPPATKADKSGRRPAKLAAPGRLGRV